MGLGIDTAHPGTGVPGGLGATPGLGGLEDLARRAGSLTDQELTDVAQKLEGVFVSMLVKTMRESMSDEGLFGEGSEGEIYGGFFDQSMGEAIAQRGGLGISEMVIRTAWRDEGPTASESKAPVSEVASDATKSDAELRPSADFLNKASLAAATLAASSLKGDE